MSDTISDMSQTAKIKLIQRWIGAPQSGHLNDPLTVTELLKDVTGLQAYLIEKEAKAARPEPVMDPNAPRYQEVKHSTPNKGGKIDPKGIVVHHSCGSFLGSLSWIKKAESQVSYNVIIHPDGTRHIVVPLNRRAWHAGRSKFAGKNGCNGFMVGVAFSGDTYKRTLTDDEINSFVEFYHKHRKEYGWNLSWVTDHRTVSPGRKNDLNPVEMRRLLDALERSYK